MTETLKPGTRCECFDGACEHESDEYGNDRFSSRCPNEAVRMVTVPWGTQWTDNKYAQIPMCGPCARWHEENTK